MRGDGFIIGTRFAFEATTLLDPLFGGIKEELDPFLTRFHLFFQQDEVDFATEFIERVNRVGMTQMVSEMVHERWGRLEKRGVA